MSTFNNNIYNFTLSIANLKLHKHPRHDEHDYDQCWSGEFDEVHLAKMTYDKQDGAQVLLMYYSP